VPPAQSAVPVAAMAVGGLTTSQTNTNIKQTNRKVNEKGRNFIESPYQVRYVSWRPAD
jgi:hypothetical protein